VHSVHKQAGDFTRRHRLESHAKAASEHPITRLQTLAGNAAISSFIGSVYAGRLPASPLADLQSRSAPYHFVLGGLIAVQRQAAATAPPAKAVSLASGMEVDAFSGWAVAYWRNNPKQTLRALAGYLVEQANVLLRQNGVPPMTLIPGRTQPGDVGEFTDENWTIKVDLDEFAADTQPPIPGVPLQPDSALSDVSAMAAGKLAGACYHEARHCEVAFLRTRVAAERMKGPKSRMEDVDPDEAGELARAQEVPVRIAWEALAAAPLSDADRSEVERIVPMGPGGRYYDYRRLNDKLMSLTTNLKAILVEYLARRASAAPLERFGPLVPILKPAIHDWVAKYRPEAEAILERVHEVKQRTQIDDDVATFTLEIQDDLDRMAIEVDRLEAAVLTAREDAAKPKAKGADEQLEREEASLKVMQIDEAYLETWLAILELHSTAQEAYRAYPHEVDAYAVMGRVESDVQGIATKAQLGVP